MRVRLLPFVPPIEQTLTLAHRCRSHATLACYKALLKGNPALLRHWERTGQAKIALKSEGGEEELLLLQAQATSLGMAARTIQDA